MLTLSCSWLLVWPRILCAVQPPKAPAALAVGQGINYLGCAVKREVPNCECHRPLGALCAELKCVVLIFVGIAILGTSEAESTWL